MDISFYCYADQLFYQSPLVVLWICNTNWYTICYSNIWCSINIRETEVAIKNGQSRSTGNLGYTRRRNSKQKHNTICVEHHYTQNMDGSILPVKWITQLWYIKLNRFYCYFQRTFFAMFIVNCNNVL